MAKKNITITLYTSELIYDVQNKTYLTGRSRADGTNIEQAAYMQANDDEESANQVFRSVCNAFGLLKTKLSEYIVDAGTAADNELVTDDEELKVTLLLPSNFNAAARDGIAATMHQYIVNAAIGDWLRITDKADAPEYVALASKNLEQIREALSKRVRPTRTKE